MLKFRYWKTWDIKTENQISPNYRYIENTQKILKMQICQDIATHSVAREVCHKDSDQPKPTTTQKNIKAADPHRQLHRLARRLFLDIQMEEFSD